MTNQQSDEELDKIFEPIQAEYDGGEPMMPGTIPEAKQALKARDERIRKEAQIYEVNRLSQVFQRRKRFLGYIEFYKERRLKELKRLTQPQEADPHV